MNFIFVLLALSIIAGLTEYLYHISALKTVPLRIHINGSRGKSSVTRLIAAGLRSAGKRVLAKTTGSAPKIIFEDGTEKPIPRRGKPNIKELLSFFRIAKKRKPDAVVVECMAILPELQRVTERCIMKSNIGVITNVRLDHLGEMGNSLREIANALSLTIPKKGTLFTVENRFTEIFRRKSERLKTAFNPVQMPIPTDEEMRGFPYLEHKENVSLALSVCKFLGIDKEVALEGMYNAQPDVGVLRIYRIEEDDKVIEFINAFSANDPESIALIWEKVKERVEKKIVLINTRRDRVTRSKQLGKLFAEKIKAPTYIVTGSFVRAFIKSAYKCGLPKEKIINLEGSSVEKIYRTVLNIADKKTLLFATGNFVNFGWEITNYFSEKAEEIAYNV